MTARGWGCAWRAFATLDALERLGEITQPTALIAVGADVSVTPGLMRMIAGRIPNARFEVLISVAHMASLEAPNGLGEALVPVGNSILLATDIESGDAPALCERSVA
jgi:pimeloyl-ACP methyl ester carboxylesterase